MSAVAFISLSFLFDLAIWKHKKREDVRSNYFLLFRTVEGFELSEVREAKKCRPGGRHVKTTGCFAVFPGLFRFLGKRILVVDPLPFQFALDSILTHEDFLLIRDPELQFQYDLPRLAVPM